MCRKFTADELGSMDHDAKNDIIQKNWMALPASCLFSMRQKHAVMHKVRNRLLMKLPAAL